MSKEQSTITIHIVAKDAKAIAQSFMEWLDGQTEYKNTQWHLECGINTTFDYDYAAQEVTIRDIE